jgi:hypothetical protein
MMLAGAWGLVEGVRLLAEAGKRLHLSLNS